MQKNNQQKKSILAILFVLFFAPSLLHAQQAGDSLTALRQLIQVNSNYKVPTYVDVVIKNGSNYIATAQDTTTSEAEFYITQNNAYLKFGDVEQVVNDSFILMVNNTVQRMILVPNNQSIQQHMNAYVGSLLGDSSLQKIVGQYNVSTSQQPNNNATIELTSKVMAFGTLFSKEVYLIQYKEKNKHPLEYTQVKRVLVKLDSAQYNTLMQQPALKPRLIATGTGNFFLVRDITTTYTYKNIVYGDKVHLPVYIKDRITKNSSGNYIPVQAYQTFLLNQQN